jgi:hypothetical protein
MIRLRQSTASQEIPLGPFVDSTDGNTEEGGLTIANTDIKIWKTGATTLASKNSGGATYISNGVYYAVLDATDTDTIGPLVIFVHVAGALAVRLACEVLDETVYDVQFGTVAPATLSNITSGTITTATNVTTVNGLAANVITAASIATGAIDADAIADGAIDAGAIAADAITAAKIADGAIDAATFAAGAITATVIATGAIDADALAADAVTEIAAGITIPSAASIADAVWDEDATAHQTQGTFGQAIGDPAADANTIYGAVVTGATGATIAADIITIDDLLDTEVGTISTNVSTVLTRLGTPSDLGGGATVAANLSDIEAQTDDIGAAGAGLTAVPYNAAWDAEIQSEVQDAIEANNLDHLVKIAVDTDFATTVHLNSVVGHLADDGTAATFDRTTDSLEVIAGAGGGGGLDAAGVRAAVGLASANLDTQLAAIDDLIDTEVAAIKTVVDDILVDTGTTLQAELDGIQADTEDIQSRIPAALVSGRIDASVGAMAANTLTAAALAADAVTEIQAGLSTVTEAQVQSNVIDALDETLPDSVPADGTRPTVRQLLYMVGQFLWEKEVSGTTVTVNKVDGTTALMTFTLDSATDPTSISRTT